MARCSCWSVPADYWAAQLAALPHSPLPGAVLDARCPTQPSTPWWCLRHAASTASMRFRIRWIAISELNRVRRAFARRAPPAIAIASSALIARDVLRAYGRVVVGRRRAGAHSPQQSIHALRSEFAATAARSAPDPAVWHQTRPSVLPHRRRPSDATAPPSFHQNLRRTGFWGCPQKPSKLAASVGAQ